MRNLNFIMFGKEKLNLEQVEAVNSVNGIYMVAAPPGSGKTFVLQKRVTWMIVNFGIPSRNILALTFTNEAAGEMRDRIGSELAKVDIENETTVTTFHSFALKMIRMYGASAGFSRKFSLIDDTEKLKIVREVLLVLEIPETMMDAKGAISIISDFKSSGQNVDVVEAELKKRKARIDSYIENPEIMKEDGYLEEDLEDLQAVFLDKAACFKIYKFYEYKKALNSLYDFDDLILKLRDLLKKPLIRKRISKMYTHILCDETQDVDPVQEEILRLLARRNGNLFCIYDDDQAIYGFRNADPRLITSIGERVKVDNLIKLKENFRSTDNIIQAANNVINNNIYRVKKWMKTSNEEGDLIEYHSLQSKEAEAQWICDKIIELKDTKGYKYKDFAILYRNNELNKTVEQKLITNEIPYQINRTVSFFQRKEIKDMLAYLEFLVSGSDFYLERIINTPKRGIGEKSFKDFKEKSQQAGVRIEDILSISTREPIVEFCNLIKVCKRMIEDGNSLSKVMAYIIKETKYVESLKDDEQLKRAENLSRLEETLNKLHEDYPEPEDLLIQLKLMSEDDSDLGELSDGKINLMTMHASKGRGYEVVFVIGCEEGTIPSRSAFEVEQIEEERRIMYVAITRAKKHCYLTRSKFRVGYNGTMKATVPSPFLYEIPKELIAWNDSGVSI